MIKKTPLILVLAVILIFSCNEQALKLKESTLNASNLLIQYYDNLIQYTIDSWELEAFNSSLREIEFPEDEQKEYLKTIESLKQRKALLTSLNKTVNLLEEYIKYNKTDEFKLSAAALSNNINELKPVKDSNVVLPSNIFGSLAGDIVKLVQFAETKSLNKAIVKVLSNIKELFKKEKVLYLAVIEERNIKSMSILKYLIDNEKVSSWPLISHAPKTVELEIYSDHKPVKEEKHKKALKKVLEVKYYRMKYLNENAYKSLVLLLDDLIIQYNEYLKGKKGVFDNIIYLSKRTAYYFNEINDYMQNYTDQQKKALEIIYRGNTETKVFHQPGCQYYNSNNNTAVFYSREEALQSGYKPCDVCKP